MGKWRGRLIAGLGPAVGALVFLIGLTFGWRFATTAVGAALAMLAGTLGGVAIYMLTRPETEETDEKTDDDK